MLFLATFVWHLSSFIFFSPQFHFKGFIGSLSKLVLLFLSTILFVSTSPMSPSSTFRYLLFVPGIGHCFTV